MVANSAPVLSYGKKQLSLAIRRVSFQWPFHLAKVVRIILGVDFLCHFGFLVNVCNKCLVKADTWDSALLMPQTSHAEVFKV